MILLALESSCDETSAAILEDGRTVLSSLVSTQIPVHEKFGGVVPEIASRMHLEAINRILRLTFEQAGKTPDDLDLVAVTRGPGLVGALLVGVAAAKAIAFAKEIPIVGVNHMEGHIAANYLSSPDLAPPFLTLVVSGGHTYLAQVRDYGNYKVYGSTRDDAAGESFDKVARVLGLGYPGGPKIQKLAEEGDPQAIAFPRAMMGKEDGYDFSFSGLKTAVMNYLHHADQLEEKVNRADVAASFQQAVIEVLTQKSRLLIRQTGMKRFCLSGGVAANLPLRAALKVMCWEEGVSFYVPPMKFCTDNAAMIGAAGYYQFKYRGASPLNFTVDPNLGLS